jgi:class 3 adenylate cyclase
LLRSYRLAAELTQEELAERAGVSSRSIQALERGENRPQQETARRLADALALDEPDRARLLRGVTPIPRRREVAEVAPAPAEPAMVPAPSDDMLTVLVADIRGYTAFTHQHGDAAGAALASRFAALAGKAVAAEGGRVVEVRGDEVLAVFSSARAALRAATGLQARCAAEASAALRLQAGVGLDVGEPVAVAGGYRGEVLASETVVHLARRVEGLAYQERGELALKGIPLPVRTWSIRAALNEKQSIEAPTSGTTHVVTPGPGVPEATPTFGELLRRYRLAAGISQERLAGGKRPTGTLSSCSPRPWASPPPRPQPWRPRLCADVCQCQPRRRDPAGSTRRLLRNIGLLETPSRRWAERCHPGPICPAR